LLSGITAGVAQRFSLTLIQLAAGNQKAQNGIVFSAMNFVKQLIDIYQPA
jgi:hypothetical protein